MYAPKCVISIAESAYLERVVLDFHGRPLSAAVAEALMYALVCGMWHIERCDWKFTHPVALKRVVLWRPVCDTPTSSTSER